MTARCGTPLAELEARSLEKNHNACRSSRRTSAPTRRSAAASRPACPARGARAAGALRDFVLGVKLIDGRGQALGFGGQVMKNVAGYDVSRLVAGSLGTLGLIAEVSLKVAAARRRTRPRCALEAPQARALELMNRWAGQPLPISATAWHDGELSVRLSGSAAAVRAAAATIGGDGRPTAAFWHGVREHTDAFFAGDEPLWRLSRAVDHAAARACEGRQLIEWNGGLRWLKSGIRAPTRCARLRGA